MTTHLLTPREKQIFEMLIKNQDTNPQRTLHIQNILLKM